MQANRKKLINEIITQGVVVNYNPTLDTQVVHKKYVDDAVDLATGNSAAFSIQGHYDADINMPDLNAILGTGTAPNHRWIVNVEGTQNITGIGSHTFTIGENIVVNAANNGYYVQETYSNINDNQVDLSTTFSSKKLKRWKKYSQNYNIQKQDLLVEFTALNSDLVSNLPSLTEGNDGDYFIISNSPVSTHNVLIIAPEGVVFLDTQDNTILLEVGDMVNISFDYANSVIVLNNN